MKLSCNWLNEWLQTDLSPETLSEILTDTGLEVEDIIPFASNPSSLEKVCIGKVLAVSPHPNAQKLKVCKVEIAPESISQIVCGANNVAPGQTVVLALPGAVLSPLGAKQPLEIEVANLRGELSEGMICSAAELGITHQHEGIWILNSTLPPGTPASELFKDKKDTVLEVNITPNRVDATCHFGAARDIAAKLNLTKRTVSLKQPFPENTKPLAPAQSPRASIEAQSACGRYASVFIRNLKVCPAPEFIQNKLSALGVKSQNAIVDILNYVMLDFGLPMHAFDADQMKGETVFIRNAKEGETLETLDGILRNLNPEDIVIADYDKPLCLAGVYGGINASVKTNTTNIMLEAAWFSPSALRKMARRHGIHTDASFRFERGASPEIQVEALKRSVELITRYCGGEAYDFSDITTAALPQPVTIQMKPHFISDLAGWHIEDDLVASILTDLGFKVDRQNSIWTIVVPRNKPDVTHKADIAEEVIRIVGFDAIPSVGNIKAAIPIDSNSVELPHEEMIKSSLTGMGFREAITLSMVGAETLDEVLTHADYDATLAIANPLSSEGAVLRTHLTKGMMQVLARNLNHGNKDLLFFEMGRTYRKAKSANAIEEDLHLCIGVTGNNGPDNWTAKPVKADFYLLKGTIDRMFLGLGLPNIGITPSEKPGRWEVTCQNTTLGFIYWPSAATRKQWELRQEVWIAELKVSLIKELAPRRNPPFKTLPKFPGVKRDFALLAQKDLAFDAIRNVVMNGNHAWIESLNVFDVYQGKGIPEGMVSLAVSIQFRNPEATLREEDVEAICQAILIELQASLGVELRQ
jgi:phenylalanyl-tRNA synthetase beta chain